MISAIFKLPVLGSCSVLGMGYLHVWNRHWPAFLGVVIACFLAIFTKEITSDAIYSLAYGGKTGQVALQAFCENSVIAGFYVYVLSILLGWLFVHLYEQELDNLVLDVMGVQLLVLGFSGAGTVALASGIRESLEKICTDYLACPLWMYFIVVLCSWISIPFFLCRLFDNWELWPAAYLRVRFGYSVLPHSIATLSSGIYALIVIYLAAFIVFELDVAMTVDFFLSMLYVLTHNLSTLWATLVVFFGEDGKLHHAITSIADQF